MSDSKNNTKWLGSPLRVHRRCDSPMFEICNKTTYQDKMLHATKNKDMVEDPMYMSQWFNIGGRTTGSGNHYIPEQGKSD